MSVNTIVLRCSRALHCSTWSRCATGDKPRPPNTPPPTSWPTPPMDRCAPLLRRCEYHALRLFSSCCRHGRIHLLRDYPSPRRLLPWRVDLFLSPPPPTHIPTPPSVWNLCTLVLFSFPVSSLVSQSGQAVRRYAGKQRDLGLNLLRFSFLLKNCGLWTLSCDFVHHPFFF